MTFAALIPLLSLGMSGCMTDWKLEQLLHQTPDPYTPLQPSVGPSPSAISLPFSQQYSRLSSVLYPAFAWVLWALQAGRPPLSLGLSHFSMGTTVGICARRKMGSECLASQVVWGSALNP